MQALSQSAELQRRGAVLRDRSVRMRAAAAERRAAAAEIVEKSRRLDARRPDAVAVAAEALMPIAHEAIARARATRDQVRRGRSQRQASHESAFARLQARHQAMAVIEQAKGIIMAQRWCGPEAAHGLLRQASQQTNVKLRVLAARIVKQAASGTNGANPTPVALDAIGYLRPRTRTRPPTEG